ncbi:MAG: signal peptidase II [Planctomycetes bacterium]|nr:signal peptidase II [Planctomycetota bacterium]
MNRSAAILVYLIIAGGAIALDLWSKVEVFDYLGAEIVHSEADGKPLLSPGREVPVIDGYFNLEAAINLGAFSGWFYGMRTLLLGVSCLWVVGTLAFVVLRPRHERLLVVALALTAGGAFGNLWDRYFHHAVRDFVKWYVVVDGEPWVWPNFNIADSCICVGVGLILLRELLVSRAQKRARKEPATADA